MHAGPVRFLDLQAGLTGIASNLLTDRLRQLQDDGLVRRREAAFGVAVYELTELGESTGPLLFELAMFGATFTADPDIRPPGNLRTVAITLQEACRRAVEPELSLRIELRIDEEPFEFLTREGRVTVRYQPAANPEAIITTSYEPMVAAADGDLAADEFVANHVQVDGNPEKASAFLDLLGRALLSPE